MNNKLQREKMLEVDCYNNLCLDKFYFKCICTTEESDEFMQDHFGIQFDIDTDMFSLIGSSCSTEWSASSDSNQGKRASSTGKPKGVDICLILYLDICLFLRNHFITESMLY